MKVTDKMVKAARWVMDKKNYADQDVKARHTIEAAMQAAWVKFDIDNQYTYPTDGQRCVVVIENEIGNILIKYDIFEYGSFSRSEVTQWMPMPEHIKENNCE